jgi:hypothetical protein
LPKQNRPLVRDGRLQGGKKRTDRSYLRPAAAPAQAPEADGEFEPPAPEPDAVADILVAQAPDVAAASAAVPGRLPSGARALQQQGVRRRRDVDLQALARADTRYAFHELRRIAILTTLIIITLVVLAIVLR